MNRHTRIIKKVIDMYPEAECELDFRDAYELLVATILSAQTTDKQVNLVTVNLFEVYPTVYDLAKATPKEVGIFIKSIGLYNTKAKNIINASKIIVEEYDGIVPKDMDKLTSLPGVGRKTANVVMSNAYGVPSFAVDTHVKRVSFRLGLTKNTDPDKVELDITSRIPKYLYIRAHHALIFHGRRTCKASSPMCNQCELTKDCPYYKNTLKE